MTGPDELYTLQAVDAFINLICQNMPLGFSERAAAASPEELQASPKLAALAKALARRKELAEEITTGIRSPDGHIHVPV